MKRTLLVRRVGVALLIGASMVIASCKHDPIIPDQPAVSFSHDVMPIIAANCQSSGCHGQVNSSELQLLTYSHIVNNNGLVVPLSANSSSLYAVITGHSGEGMMPPPPQNPLSDKQIKLIYLWIMQGAKNN